MVKLLVGVKGTGKTKKLIELVGVALENSKGNVVVVEKGNKLIYDINYKARLVDTEQYAIEDAQSLYGFIAGLVAADHDLTDLFIDNTIKICNFDKEAFLKTAECAKSLVLKLEEFKSVIVLSAQNRTVYTICRYVQELAAEFHSFYNANRVICDDKELMKSRLALMVAIKTTLKNALDILAVSAPERM